MTRIALEFGMALGARGGSAAGGILLSLLVARSIGSDGLGKFAVFLGLLGTLAILARRGQDMLLIRAVAWSRAHANAAVGVGLLRFALMRVLLPSAALAVLGAALLASGLFGVPFAGAVPGFLIALPLTTGLALVSAYAKGISRTWLAPMFEIGGISLVASMLIFLLMAVVGAPGYSAIMLGMIAAMVLLVLVAILFVLRESPHPNALESLTAVQSAELKQGELDFTTIALSAFLVQAGAFVLAAPFLAESDLGLLRAAERLALLVSFPVLAINPFIAPRVVQRTRGGNASGLRQLILKAMLASAVLGAPMLLVLLLWPEHALALMGPEFGAAAGYLRTMAVVHFVLAALGPLFMVLNMAGGERAAMWIAVGSLLTGVVCIPAFSSAYHAFGFVLIYALIVILRVAAAGAAVAVMLRRIPE